MKKLNKTQKTKLKQDLIKGLNIFCYVVTGLSFLLGVIVGIKSCNDKKKTTVTTTPVVSDVLHRKDQLNGTTASAVNYVYFNRYINGVTFNFVGNGTFPSSNRLIMSSSNHNYSVGHLTYGQRNQNGDIELVDKTVTYLQYYGYTQLQVTNSSSKYDGQYIPRIRYKDIASPSTTYYTLDLAQEISQADYNDDLYEGQADMILDMFAIQFKQIDALELYGTTVNYSFYNNDMTQSVQLLKTIGFESLDNTVNYNDYYRFGSQLTVMSLLPYGSQTSSSLFYSDDQLNNIFGGTTTPAYTQVVFDGHFNCNGAMYSQIVVSYMNVVDSNSNGWHILPYSLYYISDNNEWLAVARNTAFDTDDPVSNNSLTTFQWTNSIYQTIFVYYYYQLVFNGSLLRYNTTDEITLLGLISSDTITPVVDGNYAIGSVFGLISMAFTSITSFLGFYILPNITLGTLMFVPLVISLILFCVWLFKR